MNELTLTSKKVINANINRVFDAWLDPAMLAQFILPMPGMPKPVTKNNAKVGGEFEIVMHVGNDKMPHTGTYLEIDKPNKLIFTWQSAFSPEGSTVTLLFNDLGNNKTDVELIHVKFLDEESRDNHNTGWANILTALDNILK